MIQIASFTPFANMFLHRPVLQRFRHRRFRVIIRDRGRPRLYVVVISAQTQVQLFLLLLLLQLPLLPTFSIHLAHLTHPRASLVLSLKLSGAILFHTKLFLLKLIVLIHRWLHNVIIRVFNCIKILLLQSVVNVGAL